jgi:hypothetical protein
VDNLASGRELSTFYFSIPENNFSFFACHARKPSNHKGFPRLQAGNLPEKTFRPVVNFGGSPAGKQGERLPGGTSHKVLLTSE